MKKCFRLLLLLLLVVLPDVFLAAQNADLSLGSGDLWISQGADGGYHLYIRAKPGIRSVLITESTKDPTGEADNFAYRAKEKNSINGNEIRMLNGKPIPQSLHIYSLIDSTPENVAGIGSVFHIYIPYIVDWGYPNGRHGETYVGEGTYLNIRSFALPYADYRGRWQDNPFVLKLKQAPLKGPPAGNYMKDTRTAFQGIAKDGGGRLRWSKGPGDTANVIKTVLTETGGGGQSLDLVICLDTTASMVDDLGAIKTELVKTLKYIQSIYSSCRVGMVLFRDYGDLYLTRDIPLSSDLASLQRQINGASAGGGSDIPEAVYEALYDAGAKLDWKAQKRVIILIGDAPPHPLPRGKITRDMAMNACRNAGAVIEPIILPQ
jgi:hypothetical protein